MRDNNLKYGFNMNILDDARSFPSLWSRTRSFINAHPELIHPDADLDWLLDSHNSGDYNNCQFFSNFEIGSLNFFRGESNEKYFDWLDRGGGFYYERFGDAPIHTLSVAMFVPKSEIWFFRDIGYQHDISRCVHFPYLPRGMKLTYAGTALRDPPTAASASPHQSMKTFTASCPWSHHSGNRTIRASANSSAATGWRKRTTGRRKANGRLVAMGITVMS